MRDKIKIIKDMGPWCYMPVIPAWGEGGEAETGGYRFNPNLDNLATGLRSGSGELNRSCPGWGSIECLWPGPVLTVTGPDAHIILQFELTMEATLGTGMEQGCLGFRGARLDLVLQQLSFTPTWNLLDGAAGSRATN